MSITGVLTTCTMFDRIKLQLQAMTNDKLLCVLQWCIEKAYNYLVNGNQLHAAVIINQLNAQQELWRCCKKFNYRCADYVLTEWNVSNIYTTVCKEVPTWFIDT